MTAFLVISISDSIFAELVDEAAEQNIDVAKHASLVLTASVALTMGHRALIERDPKSKRVRVAEIDMPFLPEPTEEEITAWLMGNPGVAT